MRPTGAAVLIRGAQARRWGCVALLSMAVVACGDPETVVEGGSVGETSTLIADPAPPQELVGAAPLRNEAGEVTAVVLTMTTCLELSIDTAEVRSIDVSTEPPSVVAVEGVVNVGKTLSPGTTHQETVAFESPSIEPSYAASFFSDGLNYGVRLLEAQSMSDDEIAIAEGVVTRSSFEEMSANLCS